MDDPALAVFFAQRFRGLAHRLEFLVGLVKIHWILRLGRETAIWVQRDAALVHMVHRRFHSLHHLSRGFHLGVAVVNAAKTESHVFRELSQRIHAAGFLQNYLYTTFV